MSYYLPGVINVSCCPLSDVLFILLLYLFLELQILNYLRMSYYLPGVINVSCCPLSDILFILLLYLLLELQALN